MLPAWSVTLALLGQPVPDWPAKPAEKWVQGAPASLSDLRGKVVLVRFFTDASCPYCSETAPALNELHREFASRGLVVIGVYTPKPEPRRVKPQDVRALARTYAFEFPVVIDDDWGALNALWLDRVPGAEFTSASLLIDRHGIVRHVQEGGAYAKDAPDAKAREDFQKMHDAIETLLLR
jgi:peroxiredoxin